MWWCVCGEVWYDTLSFVCVCVQCDDTQSLTRIDVNSHLEGVGGQLSAWLSFTPINLDLI